MKKGDTVDVTVAGQVVAQATIRDIEDGKAVLIVPGTRVVMGIRSELTDLPEEEAPVQTIIDGVDRAPAAPAPAAPAPMPAPVVLENVETPTPVETPVVPAPVAPAEPAPGQESSNATSTQE